MKLLHFKTQFKLCILPLIFADVTKIDFQSLMSLAEEGIDVSFLKAGRYLI